MPACPTPLLRRVLCPFAFTLLIFSGLAAASATEGQWRKLPCPPGPSGRAWFSDIGLEGGNTLWVMAGSKVFCWDGKEYRTPDGPRLRSGIYLTKFLGGPRTGLYTTQPCAGDQGGRIYRLSDGIAIPVADIPGAKRRAEPRVYTSRAGKLFQWQAGPIAVYSGKGWSPTDPSVRMSNPRIFDNGSDVWFFEDGKLVGMDGEGRVASAELAVKFRGPRPMINGARWGDHRAVFLSYGMAGVVTADLKEAKLLDATAINAALEGRLLYDLFTGPDGSVWILAIDRRRQDYVFVSVAPDGRIVEHEETAGFRWDNRQFRQFPNIVQATTDGSIWIGIRNQGILRLKDGQTRLFDSTTGLDLSECRKLIEDSRGRIYALTSHGVYVYAKDASLLPEGLIEGRPPIAPRRLVWHTNGRSHWLGRAWAVGGRVAVLQADTSEVSLIDPANGKRTGQVNLDLKTKQGLWCTPAPEADTMIVSGGDKIHLVDLKTAEIRRTTEYDFDRRLAPVPVGTDYVVVKGGRGKELVRITSEGEPRWTCRLPGYVQTHPAVGGSIVLVQTRQGSYGGQTSTGVDLETGKILWSDRINSYGYGAVFNDDATRVVEAGMWLSPENKTGPLTCREPRSGKPLWKHERRTTISHAPVIDGQSGRVYAVGDRGDVFCVGLSDGKLLWECRLPERPRAAVNPSYDPAWTAISLWDGAILVLDSADTLQVLDAADGHWIAALRLVVPPCGDNPYRPDTMLMSPVVFEGNLIMASHRGLAAFRIVDTPRAVR